MQAKILKGLIDLKAIELFPLMEAKEDVIFSDDSMEELYWIVRSYYDQYDDIPTVKYLKEYLSLEKETKADKALKEVMDSELVTDVRGILDLHLKTIIKNNLTKKVKAIHNKLKLSSVSDIEEMLEELQEAVEDSYSYISNVEASEALLFGDDAADNYRKRYRQSKQTQDFFVGEYGLKEIDDHTGGVIQGDLITILGYTNQGKSPLMRFIAYQQILRGKNVVIFPLETTKERIEESFYLLHANNTKRFGYGKPRITSDDLKHGRLTEEQESYFLDEVVPDFTNSKDLGMLYIYQPEDEITLDKLKSKVRQIHNSVMPVDYLILDAAYLVSPYPGASLADKDAMNSMLRKLRLFGLTFGRGKHPLQIVNAHQTQRKGFEKMLSNENHLYDLTAVSDFNSIERDSTMIISVAMTPEMQDANEVQIQNLKARESKLFKTFKVQFDGATGRYFSAENDMSEDDAVEVIEDLDII